MKRSVINLIISVLFSFTIILTIISLTILNHRFVMKVIDQHDYVTIITDNINKDLKENNIDYSLDKKSVKEYIKKYVKSRYKYEEYKSSNKDADKIINKYIIFMSNKNYKKYSYMLYLLTLISIIITGNIFLKSKRIHNLESIFIYTFILLTIAYGSIYFMADNMPIIVQTLVSTLNHIILAVGIVLLEIGLLKKIKVLDNLVGR